MIVPEEYIIQKFYQHAGYAKFIKSTNTYTGGCPICREGKSWGRKSRLYYIPNDSKLCCHNCGWYGTPINWVMEVEQLTYKEVAAQIKECDYEYGLPVETIEKAQTTELPRDSINLFDRTQLTYYKDNDSVKRAVDVIVDRKLNKAVNRPRTLYTSLTDVVHKNRLIIPFYNQSNECIFYQSRKLFESDTKPKYLSKMNSEKSLFNYNNVSSSTDNVFITEGPIDSFFIEDSVAVAGIQERSKESLTPVQAQQLERLFLVQTVWVLDSQWLDQTSLIKTETLLKNNQCVFIWPRNIGEKFKDINEMCVYFDIDRIGKKYILENTYCGLKGIVKLKQIK